MVSEGQTPDSTPETWELTLYIAGQTPRSLMALDNLKRFCEAHLDAYHIEIIDLLDRPELAFSDQIFAIPTLVRKLPQPLRKIIGDLSQVERVKLGLNVRSREGADDAR